MLLLVVVRALYYLMTVAVRGDASTTPLFVTTTDMKRRRDLTVIATQRRSFDISPPNEFDLRRMVEIFVEEKEGKSLVPLSLAGIQQMTNGTAMIVLSDTEQCRDVADAYTQCLNTESNIEEMRFTGLPVPLSPSLSNIALSLLSRAYSSDVRISKSSLLLSNSLLVNRDGGIFDNLPWSTWSIDPLLRERDAAGNVVEAKYTFGKRTAYQRFMGKDWRGQSLSVGNMANRIRYLLEREDNDGDCDEDGMEGMTSPTLEGSDSKGDAEMMLSLTQRLLQLEIKDTMMEIAECEQCLAIITVRRSLKEGGADEDVVTNEELIIEEEKLTKEGLENAMNRLQTAEASLQEVEKAMLSPAGSRKEDNRNREFKKTKTRTLLSPILDKFDCKEEMSNQSILQYSSPYKLLIDIIDKQLNSKIVGCVLESTSLLEGNLVLGGAILLERKGVAKSSTLMGEVVKYTDDDDDLGNEQVLPRSMYVVECFSDEAVGIALASRLPIFVDEGIYSRAGGAPVKLDLDIAVAVKIGNAPLSVTNRMPPVRLLNPYLPQIEGDIVTSEMESNRVRISLPTTPQLFDRIIKPNLASAASSSVFSTFDPVRSLEEYDSLTNDGKVRLLLKLESFTGVLPRPRAVRSSRVTDKDGLATPSLLDELLVPLIDESIRRQYKIRDAERRKDYAEADSLRSFSSPRQVAIERAQQAREDGLEEEAKRMEEEAEFYKSLRADATQDESSYSRFLDRDEWYERETQARIKRMKNQIKNCELSKESPRWDLNPSNQND
jgi:hypothetical protein